MKSRIWLVNLILYALLAIISLYSIVGGLGHFFDSNDLGVKTGYLLQLGFELFVITLLVKRLAIVKYLISFHMILSAFFWTVSQIIFFLSIYSSGFALYKFALGSIGVLIYPWLAIWVAFAITNTFYTIKYL